MTGMDEYSDIDAVRQFCDERAQHGRIASVRDPSDTRGLKNLFIECVLRQAVFDEMPSDTEGSVLDLGCGSGLFSEVLAHRARRVCGVDISPEMLRLTSAVTERNVLFSQFDGYQLPFADGAFTSVVSREIVHLISDSVLKRLYRDVSRVLSPDGTCICVEFASSNEARQGGAGQRSERSPERFIALMAESGLTCVDFYPVRRGRSLLQYLIRYGVFGQKRIETLAQRELYRMKNQRNYSTNYNADWLFKLKRSD